MAALPPAEAGAGLVQTNNGTLFFTAKPGETNQVRVIRSGEKSFHYPADITEGPFVHLYGPTGKYILIQDRSSNMTYDTKHIAGCASDQETDDAMYCLAKLVPKVAIVLGDGNDYADAAIRDSIYVDGGPGNDILNGGQGDDFLTGDLGDDRIEGDFELVGEPPPPKSNRHGSGRDKIFGGDGNDTLDGMGSGDTINGMPGNDNLKGGDGSDVMDGGPGADRFDGGPGAIDLVSYAAKNAVVVARADKSSANNGPQGENDKFTSIEAVEGGKADDRLDGNYQNNRLIGGPGNDTLNGNGGGDDLLGSEGDDRLNGGAGPDDLAGGPGRNDMRGDSGSDRFFGGPEDDEMRGGSGGDDFSGGGGPNDLVDYRDHDRSVRVSIDSHRNDGGNGGKERDIVRGDVEQVSGTERGDKLLGSAHGGEVFYARGGDDFIKPGKGHDTVYDGDGDDTLYAKDGASDNLNCGLGTDTAFIDAGLDKFPGVVCEVVH